MTSKSIDLIVVLFSIFAFSSQFLLAFGEYELSITMGLIKKLTYLWWASPESEQTLESWISRVPCRFQRGATQGTTFQTEWKLMKIYRFKSNETTGLGSNKTKYPRSKSKQINQNIITSNIRDEQLYWSKDRTRAKKCQDYDGDGHSLLFSLANCLFFKLTIVKWLQFRKVMKDNSNRICSCSCRATRYEQKRFKV